MVVVAPIALRAAYDLFMIECESRRLTDNTLRFYRGRLSLFLRWCEQKDMMILGNITHHHIRQYLIDVKDSGVSSAYNHAIARAVKTFFNYCVRDDLIEVSPFKKVKMPRLEKKVIQALTNDELRKVLRTATTERDRAIILFMLDTGIRASELCAVDIQDVNMETGEVLVRVGKGQKQRYVYMGKKARAQLELYLNSERRQHTTKDPLFLKERAPDRLTYEGLKQLLRRIKETSLIKCNAHSFRRSFAINCLRNGMNIYLLAKLMGHTDITVLRVYLAMVEDDLRNAHAQYGPADHMDL
jgi:site-specific recombinase XerD